MHPYRVPSPTVRNAALARWPTWLLLMLPISAVALTALGVASQLGPGTEGFADLPAHERAELHTRTRANVEMCDRLAPASLAEFCARERSRLVRLAAHVHDPGQAP